MLAAPAPFKFSKLESRSISPGNPTGGKGAVAPGRAKHFLKDIQPGETITLADVEGPGMVRHFWLTLPDLTPEALRSFVVRMYWDGSEYPSVETPLGDFFGLAHGRTGHFSTPYLGVSEGKGFNCFFPMPFSEHCRITFENDSSDVIDKFFFQISYTLGDEITQDTGRFHAHFRRARPPKGTNYVLLETKGTPGVYVGAVLSALPVEPGTWREGELRFFIDDDTDQATIVGTGWSDWFLSAWGLGIHQSLYAGSTYQVLHPELESKYFCSCFRFHVLDPIYFQHSLRVEHSQIGTPYVAEEWSDRADDWCSTVYWYQKITGIPIPPLPTREERLAGISQPDWEADAIERMREGIDRHDDVM